jgi:anti-sigma B factor antagonist
MNTIQPTARARVDGGDLCAAVPGAFVLELDRSDRAAVIRLHGDLDVYSASTLRVALGDLIAAEGCLAIDVELADLDFIDAAGLSVLLCATLAIRDRGGDLVLYAPKRAISRVIEITGTDETLTIIPGGAGSAACSSPRASR